MSQLRQIYSINMNCLNDITYDCNKFKRNFIYWKNVVILDDNDEEKVKRNIDRNGQLKEDGGKYKTKQVSQNSIIDGQLNNIMIKKHDITTIMSNQYISQQQVQRLLQELIKQIQKMIQQYKQQLQIQKAISLFLPKQSKLSSLALQLAQSHFNQSKQSQNLLKSSSTVLPSSSVNKQLLDQIMTQLTSQDFLNSINYSSLVNNQNSLNSIYDLIQKYNGKGIVDQLKNMAGSILEVIMDTIKKEQNKEEIQQIKIERQEQYQQKQSEKQQKQQQQQEKQKQKKEEKILEKYQRQDNDINEKKEKRRYLNEQKRIQYQRQIQQKGKQCTIFKINLSDQFFKSIQSLNLNTLQQLIQFIHKCKNQQQIIQLIHIILSKGVQWSQKTQDNCFVQFFILIQKFQNNSRKTNQKKTKFKGFKKYLWAELKKQFPKKVEWMQYQYEYWIENGDNIDKLKKYSIQMGMFMDFLTHVAKRCQYVPLQFILMMVMKLLVYIYKNIHIKTQNNEINKNNSTNRNNSVILMKRQFLYKIQQIFQYLSYQLMDFFDGQLLQQKGDLQKHHSIQQEFQQIIPFVFNQITSKQQLIILEQLLLKKHITMVKCGRWVGLLLKNGLKKYSKDFQLYFLNDKNDNHKVNNLSYNNIKRFIKRYLKPRDEDVYKKIAESKRKNIDEDKNNYQGNSNQDKNKNKKKNKKKKKNSRHH